MVVRCNVQRICFLFVIICSLLQTARSIDCYQCQSTDHDNPYQCPEFFTEGDPDGYRPEPRPCNVVHDAQFCIKQTGRFEGLGIRCYQCESAKDTSCSDVVIQNVFAQIARNCDHVFEARYCVKTNGLYGGGLGTKRFCSALDLGNYCNYVKQPGDDLEYRSCVYTCSSDGCNPAIRAAPALSVLLLVPLIAILWR